MSQQNFITPGDPLDSAEALVTYLERIRKVLHVGAMELGVTTAELEATLRSVSPTISVAGMTAGARARQVCKPMTGAAEALVTASKFVITANNRFMSAYLPELEASGFVAPKREKFNFGKGR